MKLPAKIVLVVGGLALLVNLLWPPWIVTTIRHTDGRVLDRLCVGRVFIAWRPPLEQLKTYFPDGTSRSLAGHSAIAGGHWGHWGHNTNFPPD